MQGINFTLLNKITYLRLIEKHKLESLRSITPSIILIKIGTNFYIALKGISTLLIPKQNTGNVASLNKSLSLYENDSLSNRASVS